MVRQVVRFLPSPCRFIPEEGNFPLCNGERLRYDADYNLMGL